MKSATSTNATTALYPPALADRPGTKTVRLVSLDRHEGQFSVFLPPLEQTISRMGSGESSFVAHSHRLLKNYEDAGKAGTIHGLVLDEIVDALEPESTSVVMLLNIWNIDMLASLSELLKQRNEDIYVIVGENRRSRSGVPQLRELPHVDYFINTISGHSLRSVLEGLLVGDLSDVRWLSWRLEEGVVVHSDRAGAKPSERKESPTDLNAWRSEQRSVLKMVKMYLHGALLTVRKTIGRISSEYDVLADAVDRRLRTIRYHDLGLAYRVLGLFFGNATLNRLTDSIGTKLFQNRFFPGYIAGKTRETYFLWRSVELGQIIDIEDDGFYRQGQRISGSAELSSFIRNRGVKKIEVNEYFSPFYFHSDFRFLLPVFVLQLLLVAIFTYYVAPVAIQQPTILFAIPVTTFPMVIPFYAALSFWKTSSDAPVTLWQVDQVAVNVQAEHVPKGHFTVVFNPNIIFCGSRTYNGLVMHEKAHVAFGASESAAWTIQTAQFTRSVLSLSFLNMQLLARSSEKIDFTAGLVITVLRTFIFNLTAAAYQFGFKRNWFEPTEQRFRTEAMDVAGHLEMLLEQELSHRHCSKNGIKWYDDLFVVSRVQGDDIVAYRVGNILAEQPIIAMVFRIYSRQFLRASFFYELGVVCQQLGKDLEASRHFQTVVDVQEGLSTFPKMKRFMGWSKGLLAPNNETVVNAFARLAEQRLEDLRQDD